MTARWFDSHCHLQDERFSDDIADVLARAGTAGVGEILLATSNLDDSRTACRMALEHGLYCSVGVHPHDADSWNDLTATALADLVAATNAEAKARGREPVVVAIGEIGLDYHYDLSPRDVQRTVFRRQLELARELALPLIFHLREAFADFYDILTGAKADGLLLPRDAGVAHCYSGSVESAELLKEFELLFGFDGPLTFKNARRAPDVVRMLAEDRLLLETDAPYLTPVPHRGKRNEPSYLPFVGEAMAALRETTAEQIAETTRANARRLFRLDA